MTTTRPMGTGARTAVVAPGLVVLLALLGTAVAAGPALPSRIATHFGADGTPDGWSSPWPLFWTTLAVVVAAVVLAGLAPRLRDRRTAALLLLVGNLLAGIVGTVWIVVVLLHVTGAERFGAWWTPVLVVVGAAVAAVPTVVLVRSAPPVPVQGVAPLDVGPETRVAWRARAGSTWFAVLGAAVAVLGVVAAALVGPTSAGTAWATGVLMVAAGLSAVVLARVEVTVDRRGLRLTSAWTRIPLMRVPLDRIDSCGWEQVSPGQWGGWGYRVSGRGVAYVARSGPGLVARLRGGSARMVTVADAERGAAALGALLAARQREG